MDVIKFYSHIYKGRIKMSKNTLKKRVQGYLHRAHNEGNGMSLPYFQPGQKGYWQVMSGMYELGNESKRRLTCNIILEGRYIDAIAQAIQMRVFYGEDQPKNDMLNEDHGVIVKAPVKSIKNLKSLDCLV